MHMLDMLVAQELIRARVQRIEEGHRFQEQIPAKPSRIRIKLAELLIALGNRLKDADRVSYVGV